MIKWHNFAQEILYEDCFLLSIVTWGMQYAEVHHDLSSKYACYLHKAFDNTNCTYLISLILKTQIKITMYLSIILLIAQLFIYQLTTLSSSNCFMSNFTHCITGNIVMVNLRRTNGLSFNCAARQLPCSHM